VILPRGHFDAYVDGFDQASAIERDFLVEQLVMRRGPGRAGDASDLSVRVR